MALPPRAHSICQEAHPATSEHFALRLHRKSTNPTNGKGGVLLPRTRPPRSAKFAATANARPAERSQIKRTGEGLGTHHCRVGIPEELLPPSNMPGGNPRQRSPKSRDRAQTKSSGAPTDPFNVPTDRSLVQHTLA